MIYFLLYTNEQLYLCLKHSLHKVNSKTNSQLAREEQTPVNNWNVVYSIL